MITVNVRNGSGRYWSHLREWNNKDVQAGLKRMFDDCGLSGLYRVDVEEDGMRGYFNEKEKQEEKETTETTSKCTPLDWRMCKDCVLRAWHPHRQGDVGYRVQYDVGTSEWLATLESSAIGRGSLQEVMVATEEDASGVSQSAVGDTRSGS